jgi:SAM-dependent methyltransferase
MPSVTDLLRRSAPLAQQLADSLCTTRNGNDDCGALHGVWPALRLLQLGADPTRHADFFEAAIGLLAPVSERVLISGCADWGMLDTAASIYRRRAAAMRATALDQCVTPLLLCAWYGAQTQVPVRTVCADASAFDEYAAFDMIATHSLLTYRDLAGRRELVANWHRLLAPGGAVITVTRLQPMAPADVAAASAAERGQAFAARAAAAQAASEWQFDSAQLCARAERFARAQISHPVGDAADVRALFEAAGFDVVRLDVKRIGAGADGTAPVSGAARSGNYAEIVAVKR